MSDQSFSKLWDALKDIREQISTKTTLRRVQRENNNFTGTNTFVINPLISGSNSKLISEDEADDKYQQLGQSLKPTTLETSTLTMVSGFHCYSVNSASSNITLDFSNFPLENNKKYDLEFKIVGSYYITSCTNTYVDGTLISCSLFNLNRGTGTGVVYQKITLFVETSSITILSNSYSYFLNGLSNNSREFNEIKLDNRLTEEESDSMMEVSSTTNGKYLFEFKNFGNSEVDDEINSISTIGTKTVDQGSSSLLLRCKVQSTIGGVDIDGIYHIPMYRVES